MHENAISIKNLVHGIWGSSSWMVWNIGTQLKKKICIRETKHILTNADSSTDTKKILLITSWSLLYNLLIQKCKKKMQTNAKPKMLSLKSPKQLSSTPSYLLNLLICFIFHHLAFTHKYSRPTLCFTLSFSRHNGPAHLNIC